MSHFLFARVKTHDSASIEIPANSGIIFSRNINRSGFKWGKSVRKFISEIMTNYVKIYTIDFAIHEDGIINVQVKFP